MVDCLDAYLYYGLMPRPKSDEKRSAILEAATRIIVTQGLSAPTAGIAKEAGVANGSLFTYFETKTDLFNQLYLELKTEMASAAMKGLPTGAEPREQLLHLWQHWINWAMSYPEKRGALTQLGVSDEITPKTRATRQWQASQCYLNAFAPAAPCRRPRWVSLSRSSTLSPRRRSISRLRIQPMQRSTAKRASRLCGVWWPKIFYLDND